MFPFVFVCLLVGFIVVVVVCLFVCLFVVLFIIMQELTDTCVRIDACPSCRPAVSPFCVARL